jgi:hypothetical protein
LKVVAAGAAALPLHAAITDGVSVACHRREVLVGDTHHLLGREIV